MPRRAKQQGATRERENQLSGINSGSGSISSSSRASHSAQSDTGMVSISGSAQGRYDGNRDPDAKGERDPNASRPIVDPKKFDLSVQGWTTARGLDHHRKLPIRKAPSKAGAPIKITLNTFNVDTLPSATIYQFDVAIGNGDEKRGLHTKVWNSNAAKNALGTGWIYDGNKLAWTLRPLERDVHVQVDLDAEQGRTPRPGGRPNNHRLVVRQTNRVHIDALISYMAGRTTFDNSCLEVINFLDHLLREWPTLNYTQIKRSFFARGQTRHDLGGAIEAFKGAYQSMRVVHGTPSARLSVNVDVANGTFWTVDKLPSAACKLTGKRDINDLISSLAQGSKSYVAEQLRKKMRKLRVIMKHRGGKEDEYVIDNFLHVPARDHTFPKDGKQISIYDYYAQTYLIRLQYPKLPLVLTTKKAVLPMELCVIKENQRYPFKLDERQTTGMLKVAAVPPGQRWADIQNGLRMLKWESDPVLRTFGLRINTSPVVVDARLLPAPRVQFGQGDAKPGTSGRWDLKGKKFLSPNTVPLKCWSVTVIQGRRGGKPEKAVIENFIREFIKIYQNHGGRVENKQPAMVLASGDDVGNWVVQGWNGAGNQSQMRPQMLMFVLPDKNAEVYGRIKRSTDCRYGVVSQCVQYSHVQKAQPQYISNVCMKFNAKLGGQTARAIGPKTGGPLGQFTRPTMIIGADVSHAAPGAQTPSMAALTVSTDALGIRYAADCQTNGFREEMIKKENIDSMLQPLMQHWIEKVGNKNVPQRIIYFRDGVSEGQYAHVIDQEVKDMKNLIKTSNPHVDIPFVVLVGGKRHHVRFFPEKGRGDRNDNPLPGTLVETGVTNPFENDFYLCSHAAIKGTARPMHYHVLLNEADMSNEELQTLIYEQCYQYVRSTTPVSQHPAIYYAHLASNRAIPHDNNWTGSSEPTVKPEVRPRSASRGSQGGGSRGRGAAAGHGESSAHTPSVQPDRLIGMPNQGGIQTSMWYI